MSYKVLLKKHREMLVLLIYMVIGLLKSILGLFDAVPIFFRYAGWHAAAVAFPFDHVVLLCSQFQSGIHGPN